jgi:hypothetical protein
MNREVSRVFLCFIGVILFSLLAPNSAKACSCGTTCSGSYCYCCASGPYCYDREAITNPCGGSETLAFNATPEELAAFKERIDAWSGREDFRTVVDAATELYNSVFFKDGQGFVEASDKFQQAINSLPDEARKSFIQPEQSERKK